MTPIIPIEWALAAGFLVLALTVWLVHILLDVRTTIRESLATFEDKLIQLEDEVRRTQHEAATLKTIMQHKVESTTLNKRLEGLASLMGLRPHKR